MTSDQADEHQSWSWSRRLGIAGLLFGVAALAWLIVGLALSLPLALVGLGCFPLALFGFVVSILGFTLSRNGRPKLARRFSIVGATLTLVVFVAGVVSFDAALPCSRNCQRPSGPAATTVTYYAGGTPANVTIIVSPPVPVYDQGAGSDDTTSTVALPWQQSIVMTYLFSPSMVDSLSVRAGSSGGTVTCKIAVAGRVLYADSATGPGATASCGDPDFRS